MEEIFALPARTLEEAAFDIVYSPSMADLAAILADPVHAEGEEIESTPSNAPEVTPITALEETPISSARIQAEAIDSTPTIVVQSPSMEHIPPRPPRPTRGFDEDITELLDFMNEHDCELPTFAPFDEDEDDDDSDSMKSHDLDTTSTESLTSLEDDDSDSMKDHDLTTPDNVVGTESLRNLEDEWEPIFAIIDSSFGIPFAEGRAFLDSAVEWLENEQKSSWSEESLSQLSASSSEDGVMSDAMAYDAGGGDDAYGEDESTVVNVEDKDVVADEENGSAVKMMRDENIIGLAFPPKIICETSWVAF
ncbi:hypothetical protein AGABI1DRAFT_92817 [Agaricus bisporus var. burnettii JB137-S8]|uniref:Uncharacterized protein n=1 Tax=Agaricus bisporus var. burnettii (strain JB137-S8 / ATCC MYA-4627 / FGSC 10392) TaxID=597362 RepID=K5XU01_AGABU|nr:uncharacterized protein AGABI1DRAFT_92817 [Agaricus bisporus var. burnettii JB137-S8]EKM78540.1 hypothetical protein AGABI1DRAFT_92817 [Agaricus bisporus var. burnettii JB137-S8]